MASSGRAGRCILHARVPHCQQYYRCCATKPAHARTSSRAACALQLRSPLSLCLSRRLTLTGGGLSRLPHVRGQAVARAGGRWVRCTSPLLHAFGILHGCVRNERTGGGCAGAHAHCYPHTPSSRGTIGQLVVFEGRNEGREVGDRTLSSPHHLPKGVRNLAAAQGLHVATSTESERAAVHSSRLVR